MIYFWLLIFLALSALFSGAEIAFVTASKLKIELKRKKGSKKGTILAKLFDKPADFLGSLLVGNNIALVVFTSLMTLVLNPLINPFTSNEILLLLVNTLLITAIVLMFGEFFPKTIFRIYGDDLLFVLAWPLFILKIILSVPAWFMIRLTNFLLRTLFKVSSQEAETAFTRLDLENFVKDSVTETEEEIDTNLFEKALYLKNVRVRECMVPRPEIEYIDSSASVEQLKQLFVETKMSRLIIVKEDLDDIVGYVHHQKLLDHPATIEEVVMEMPFVTEAMRIQDLLARFIKERVNIASVVDEFGSISGIITLEDILEEIFGEIEDEHDQEDYIETKVSDSEYIFSGRLEIDYLNEKYEELSFPEGDYHTLSGYVVMTTATIPEAGAEIVLDNYRFILEVVSDTRIETIRVIVENRPEKEETTGEA